MTAPIVRPALSARRSALSSLFTRLAQPFLALVGVAVALFAERIVENARADGLSAPPTESWLLFILAGLLLVVAVWPPGKVRPGAALPFIAALKAMRRPWLFLLPLALALICAAAAIPQFIILNSDQAGPQDFMPNTGSWLLWIAALLLFGAAWVVWERSVPSPVDHVIAPPRGGLLPRRTEWIIAGGLFVVALALRFYNLDAVPPGIWFDEAQNGIVARNLLDVGAIHKTFIADATQMGALYFYFLGILVKFLGAQMWVVRFLPALAGSLTVPLIYFLASRLFGWRVGVAAASLLAVSSWSITFSRFGMVSMSTVGLDVAIYLCLVQGLRTARLGWFAGAGVLLGLALQGYYIGRIVPVVLVLALLHLLFTEPRRLLALLRWAAPVFVVATLIGGLPIALFAIQRPDIYNARVNTASIFSQEGSDGNPDALSISLNRHELMFNWLGDRNPRHNLSNQPLLDWFTAALFFAGLVSCALRFWRWQYFFPIAWLAGAMSGGVLSLLFEAPQAHRTLEASVVVSLISGIFLGQAWEAVARFALRRSAPEDEKLATVAVRPSRPPDLAPPVPVLAPTHAPVAGTLLMRVRRPTGEIVRVPALSPDAAAPPPVAPPATAPPVAVRAVGVRRAPRFRIAPIVATLGAVAALIFVAAITLPRYFVTQEQSREVWTEMGGPEGHAAHIIAQYNQADDIYAGQFYVGLNHTEFLAPGVQTPEFEGMFRLPLDNRGRDAIILIDPTQANDLQRIAGLYPHATFDPLIAPGDPERKPLMWTIFIPAADLGAIQGVQISGAGAAKTATSMALSAADEANAKSVTLQSSLRVDDSGLYQFEWQAPPGRQGVVTVDGYTVNPSDSITLGIGLHELIVTDTPGAVGSGDATVQDTARLLWANSGSAMAPVPDGKLFDPQKVTVRGLTGAYHQGDSFDTPPALIRVDPILSRYYHHTPLGFPWVAVWTGALYVPAAGSYRLAIDQEAGGELTLDGNVVINLVGAGTSDVQLDLSVGFHPLQLRFRAAPAAHIYFYWTPPGHAQSVIPAAFLWPQRPSYPTPGSGPGWPTLDQADAAWPPANQVIGGAGAPIAPTPAPNPTPPATRAPEEGVSNAEDAPPVTPDHLAEIRIPALSDGSPAEPRDVAVDKDGNFYVVSDEENTVRKFSADGQPLTTWGNNAGGDKTFSELFSIVLGPDGTLYTLDADSGQIQRFDTAGRPQGEPFATTTYHARGFTFAADGNLLIADTGGAVIDEYSTAGKLLTSFGSRGAEAGQLNEPTDVAVAPNGDIYVLDSSNQRIQYFSPTGDPKGQWRIDGGSSARESGHIAFDSQGRLFVTMPATNRVVFYSADGTPIGRWQEPNQAPTGIFIDSADNIYVTFSQTGVVRKYRLPK